MKSRLPLLFTLLHSDLPREVDHFMYVRNEKRETIGFIIIDKGICGWSLCNNSDKMDKPFGIFKALCKFGSKKTLKQTITERDEKLEKWNTVQKTIKPYFYKMSLLIAHLKYVQYVIIERNKKAEADA